MIKIENVVTPSHEQWEVAIRGMRNPMNSWDRSDSEFADGVFYMGDDDMALAENLSSAGEDHRKFLRMIVVYMDITAPLYWWKEYDTYKVGTVANSCSTMHKIHAKEFTVHDFSCEHLSDPCMCVLWDTIDALNEAREKFLQTKEKEHWWDMIQLLPSSYNQKRTVTLNYEVLLKMYRARRKHKLDCWRDFCEFIETLPYAKELICGVDRHFKTL